MKKDYPTSNYRDYRPTRNPYGEKIREFTATLRHPTLLADFATEENRGRWREHFKAAPDAFLQLELGAYHGETSIHLARTNPKAVHLGVEWKYKQCFKAGKKANDLGLSNLTFLRANIARLGRMVAPGEVDRVWVLFPDPWSKAPQQKWRVLQPGFFCTLGALLKPGKELMIKTDHADYAAYIKGAILEAGCFDPMPEAQAKEVWSLIPPTPFERIFLRQGLPIHSFALVRNSQTVIPPEEVQKILAI
jgi:tRNA (guanine-N7-)-methyltransferase